jgi:hypothetical protein
MPQNTKNKTNALLNLLSSESPERGGQPEGKLVVPEVEEAH